MTKLKETQDGFGAIEALLGIIAITLIGFVGFYVFNANKNTDKTNSVTSQAVPNTVDTKTASVPGTVDRTKTKEGDHDAVIDAVKAYSLAGVSQKDAAVDVRIMTNNNATGTVKSGTTSDDGINAQFIAHKEGNVWSVVFEGQQAPDSELGKKYDLPTDWYQN